MSTPWPEGARAALSITLDNMGEAADLNRNLWPSDKPVGSHYSVTSALPSMLLLLSKHNVRATYFIEAWNCGIYPNTIRDAAALGHEVGFHAWQHEVWSSLDAQTEVANLDRSVKAVEEVMGSGWRYRGFRPPGGLVTERTLRLMKERGFTYLSPAAETCAVVDDVAMVPFQWRDIDAYYYLPSLAPVRKRDGLGEDVLSASDFKKSLLQRVAEIYEKGEYAAFLFHPFLTNGEERLSVMREVLEEVVKRRDRGELWVAPCEEIADWVREHKGQYADDPGWDRVEWKTK